MDLFSFLGIRNYRLGQNLNFTHDTLQEIRVEFQKATFKKTNVSQPFLQCVSMKPCEYVHWLYLVGTNKSARICLNLSRNTVIQSLKRGKLRKSGLAPMLTQEKIAELFMVFSARLETCPDAFHLCFFISLAKPSSIRLCRPIQIASQQHFRSSKACLTSQE